MELKQFDESYIGTVESYKMDSLYFGRILLHSLGL